MRRLAHAVAILVFAAIAVVSRVAAATCTYMPAGANSALLHNASQQTFSIEASTPACLASLGAAANLVGTSVSIPVRFTASAGVGPAATPARLTLTRPVPAASTGSVSWTIQDNASTAIGTFQATVADLVISDPPTLGIRYDAASAILQSGASTTATDATYGKLGIGVVGVAIQNEARLAVPSGVPTAPSATSNLQWTVLSTNWGQSILFDQCITSKGDTGRRRYEDCDLGAATSITFRILEQQLGPLVVDLQLQDRSGPSPVVLYDVFVPLAASARTESVPLRFASAVKAVCTSTDTSLTDANTVLNAVLNDKQGTPDPRLQSGGDADTIAVSGDQITLNRCWLVVDSASFRKEIQDSLEQYGPQPLTILVHKDGTDTSKDVQTSWVVDAVEGDTTPPPPDPTKPPQTGDSAQTSTFDKLATPKRRPVFRSIAHIPQPNVDSSGDGFYTVTVKLQNPPPPYVVYRDGATDASLLDTFSVRLQLRGAFAWSSSVRTFITVPINVTAVRFGASSVDLKSSSSPTSYETTTLTTGILLGVEHWDYKVSRNNWAVPIRGLAGMQLLNFSNLTFAPSLMLGASATFPVVESPASLGSSLALGAFWEVDLREPRPIDHGGHLLITLGFNVLSLGSPSTPTSK